MFLDLSHLPELYNQAYFSSITFYVGCCALKKEFQFLAMSREGVEPAPGQRPVSCPFISVGTPDGSVDVSYQGYRGNMFRPPGYVGAWVYLISIPTYRYRRYPDVGERQRRQR